MIHSNFVSESWGLQSCHPSHDRRLIPTPNILNLQPSIIPSEQESTIQPKSLEMQPINSLFTILFLTLTPLTTAETTAPIHPTGCINDYPTTPRGKPWSIGDVISLVDTFTTTILYPSWPVWSSSSVVPLPLPPVGPSTSSCCGSGLSSQTETFTSQTTTGGTPTNQESMTQSSNDSTTSIYASASVSSLFDGTGTSEGKESATVTSGLSSETVANTNTAASATESANVKSAGLRVISVSWMTWLFLATILVVIWLV